MVQTQKLLVVLLGPTGVGKTALSIHLAKLLGSPILSSDSRQIYQGIPIGTAAATAEEKAEVEHLFVDRLGLEEYYSAAEFEREVLAYLQDYYQSHAVAVMVGGSMMYIDAVCKGLDELPTIPSALRQEITERWQTEGLVPLLEELQQLDPLYYEQVDRCNPKRVMHALEICRVTGQPYSSLRKSQPKEREFAILKIGLTRDREELYARINERVDQMMQQGLLEEARRVYPLRHCNALNTVGYKELFAHFDGLLTLEEAVEKIKQNSRIYSRKQMTWFRRDSDIHWFHPDQIDQISSFVREHLPDEG
jgi:tRNA dimethylallyltransferase